MSGKDHLARVHQIPCVVCELMSIAQKTRTEAHHPEHIRDDSSHYCAIALCVEHHTGANGVHGLSRRAFADRYQLSDTKLIALTIKGLERHGLLRNP